MGSEIVGSPAIDKVQYTNGFHVFLLVSGPLLQAPYISSPSHHLLFATHTHTIAACSAVVPMLCHLFLISVSQLLT